MHRGFLQNDIPNGTTQIFFVLHGKLLVEIYIEIMVFQEYYWL